MSANSTLSNTSSTTNSSTTNSDFPPAPKMKICCACPSTKKLRDECVVMHGEDACAKWIEAHKQCLRAEGFKITSEKCQEFEINENKGIRRSEVAMESAENALVQLVKGIGKAIQGADSVLDVVLSLSYLATLLRDISLEKTIDSRSSAAGALYQVAKACTERAQEAFPELSSKEVLTHAFYDGQSFAAFGLLLLHKVALDWLPCFSLSEQSLLFDEFFLCAPVSEALLVLVPALSHGPTSDDETNVTTDSLNAVSAQAERLLALRLIQKQGVKELTLSFCSPVGFFNGALSNSKSPSTMNRSNVSQLAQLLSAVPDKASLQAPSTLHSPLYFQSVTLQLLVAAEEHWQSISTRDSAFRMSPGDQTFQFIGEVLAKFCRRGHGGAIVSQMVPLLLQNVRSSTRGTGDSVDSQQLDSTLGQVIERLQDSVWPSVSASLKDSHAVEKLSEALLKEMELRRNVTDWEAYCVLQTLFGNLLEIQVTTRTLFTEKFLLWKILPIRCLKWVLNFAILRCPPSEVSVESVNAQRNIEKWAVGRLAEAWARKELIQSSSLLQQAYLTAAVGLCLESMDKDCLEGITGLVESLLMGISHRLDSPIAVVREMAKRTALAFSIAMDANKPLLLDEEDNVEDLRNWERLMKMALGGPQVSTDEKMITHLVEKNEVENGHRLEASIQRGNTDAEKKEKRRQRKEKLALEEDDPDAIVRFGDEYLSEDIEESSETDDESDIELRPYDMSDDEADLSRGTFPSQLADCAKDLRKGDDLDAVDRALQVAEKLILAMPEELDHLSGDLAHALVHVKCSAVEGEEDLAEQRRYNALLALLSCSPVNSVVVLTKELFSPHVDVSQRILILDVMSAGARALVCAKDLDKKISKIGGTKPVKDVSVMKQGSSWIGPGYDHGSRGAGPWVEVSSPILEDRLVGWAISYERELPLRDGQRTLGKSRRWGERAMQLREGGRIQTPQQPQKNKFAPLAAVFMLPVMREYDIKRHGVDLLGRDFLVLGGILSMLGVCMECIAMQREAAVLGAGLLEMLRSREISSHPEVFVRRAAVFAASRVLVSLHPSDVVACLNGGASDIAANLEWVRAWALEIANNDADTECSMMAMACIQLHSEMALQAMRSMETLKVSDLSLEAKLQSSSNIPIIMPF